MNFITQKPSNHFLSTLVDSYFFIDIPVSELKLSEEYIIPFPRITFGYFFDHPFLATNQDLNESEIVEMAVSRISTHKITVQPQSNRVKILGAHLRPYTLAYLTQKPITTLPWIIKAADMLEGKATTFKQKTDRCTEPKQMFDEVEKLFLDILLARDLTIITRCIDMVEVSAGNIKLADIAVQLNVSEKTLRNQFHKHIGCAPKEYMQLVKLKKSVYDMKFSDSPLTNITYDSNYSDQAHFINSVRRITGKSPKKLRKEMPDFRFLQF